MTKDWEVKKIGKICEVIAGQSPESKYYNNTGDGLPFYQGKKQFGDKFIQSASVWTTKITKEAKSGDILMSVRAPVGPTNFATERICIGRGLAAIRSGDTLNKDYLFYFFKHFEESIEGTSGAVFDSINKSQIEDISLLVPNLKEQKRIVGILDEKFEAIEKLKKVTEEQIKDAKELFESRSREIFSSVSQSEKYTLLELLEKEWITSHLDGNHGGDYPKKAEFKDYGVPYISANCIKNEKVDFSQAKFLSEQRAAKLRKGIAQNGDVLFAHNATVGPVAILETNEEKVILSTSLTYYRCNSDYISNSYLAHFMRSPIFKTQYESVMKQMTRNQVPITKQREFYFYIPSLKMQDIIGDELNKLSTETTKLELVYKSKVAHLEELKKSYLEQAFAGKL